MKHFLSLMFLAAVVAAPAAFAQKWEVGFGAGGSFLTSETISNPAGNADAGRNPGLALSAWLDNNIGSGLFAGELRYDHENGDLKLSSGGTNVTFGSQSNAVHYDFLYQLHLLGIGRAALRGGGRRREMVFGHRARAGFPTAVQHRGV